MKISLRVATPLVPLLSLLASPALAQTPPPEPQNLPPAHAPQPAQATPPNPASPAPSGPAAAPNLPNAPPAHAESPAAAAAAAPAADAAASGGDEEMSMTFTAPRPQDMSQFAEQAQQEMKVAGIKTRYSLNLFGAVGGGIIGGGRDRDGNKQDTKPTFGLGAFTMLFSGNLENHIKFTAEVAIEPGEDNSIGIDLERMHIRYTHPSGFWVEAGRSHTDLGYWNLAYHHGAWLQPTIERPRGVHFEDDAGILPIHWVGAQVGWQGTVSGPVSLKSSIAVGNGRGKIVDNLQNREDENPAKQAYAQIELKGIGHRDFRLGVSGVYGHITKRSDRLLLPDQGLDEIILGAHMALPSIPVLAIAEGYAIQHRGPDRTWETYDAFALLGYALPPVTPYVKVERIVMTRGLDPFFVSPDPVLFAAGVVDPVAELDVAEGIVGARWDMSTWAALKAEYRLERFMEIERTTHVFYTSWQFGL